MSIEKDRSICLYEKRNATLISSKDGKRMTRAARFLTPCARNEQQAVRIPNTPLLSEICDNNLQKWSSNVAFQGWKNPQKDWKGWVDNLEPRYKKIWRMSGIYDSIMSSTYEIRCNDQLVLGLAEFWCPETNTFVFPWGEATITLEDVMVLGRYSVLGEPVTAMLTCDLISLVDELENKRKEFAFTRSKKASFSLWLEKYKCRGGELEHLAFLSLWLSRFVFPSDRTIGRNMFPIAALLSRGREIALAPAVLASLYRDLKSMTEHAKTKSESPIAVLAPFQLLHVWAFERFPLLAPDNPNVLLRSAQPRVARWHKLISKTNLPLVRTVLKLSENYKWRPYASDLENWHVSPFKDTEKIHSDDCSNLSRELSSFAKCIASGELGGLGFAEKYLPHRVAMQFGLDQDLPAAHNDSYVTFKRVGLCLPSKFYEPGTSMEYHRWWETSMLERQAVIERRRNPNKFVKNCLQSDTPRRQTPLNQRNFAKPNWRPEIHRTEETRREADSSSSFAKNRMEDASRQGAVLKKNEGGSYENSPYKFTGRLAGRVGPPAAHANVSANHIKRKGPDEPSSESHDDPFQGRNMKDQRVKGSFNDRGREDSAQRFARTKDGNSCKDISHNGHQVVRLEERLKRIEKFMGVDI